MILRKFIARLKGIDSFYAELPSKNIALYQKYFERLLNSVDIENCTKRSMGKDYDRSISERDDTIIERIIVEEAQAKGSLVPGYLQVILEQYFFADVWMREKDRHCWINRVLHRKDVDYFPDPLRIYTRLFQEEE